MYYIAGFVGYGVSYLSETFEKAVLCMFCANQIFTVNRKGKKILKRGNGSLLNRVNKLSLEYCMFSN